jgi:uncharacterized membrane-anchored protein
MLEGFDYQQGEIALPGNQAKLTVPNGYYYLSPTDAKKVLTDLWENPSGDSLGMIFPSTQLPTDYDSWAAVVTWDPLGYVSDKDAAEIDYDALLITMKADLQEENIWRIQNNFEPIELVGWAAPPIYDATTKKLHWAKELSFSGTEANTLNYNLRALGRKGVLQLNFIADIDQLEQIKAALPEVAAMASFSNGAQYADFDPSIDNVAAVGIGGLIAGKVLAKTGFLAVGLIFLKKFWFLLVMPFLWIGRKLRGNKSSDND